MALVCIPKHLVEKLKTSALSGEVKIAELYEMSSKERRDFFTKHTDPELGKLINTGFEKAMVSKQKSALTDWAKSVFTPTAEQKPSFKNVVDKINSLDDLGVLNPDTERAFLEDLVSDKLGITVTPDEIKEIHKRAIKIDSAQKKLGANLGSPSKLDENLEFFKAKKEMDDYLLSRNPAPKLRVATGTIGRGMMLASVKSPVLNIGSNIEVGFTEALTRRISNRALKTTDTQLAKDYIKMVNKIYQQTGYDVSRMTSLQDAGESGTRVLGETVHAEGPGKLRRAGQIVEDTVFKQLMGAPDVLFSATHFADSVNINAIKAAKGDQAKAESLMQDAMRIDPQTPQGEILRGQAILDAQVATWTNESWATNLTLGVRKIVNELSGDLRAGDYLFPFVKTPANVIATGLDYAGLGIPKAVIKTVQAVREGQLDNKQVTQSIIRDAVRGGFGLVLTLALVAGFDDDDFMGAYDPARQQIEQLRNSNYNAIRIGGKWVSVDWFGPLAVSLSAGLYAKKYGKDPKTKALMYARGGIDATMTLPGVEDVADYFRAREYKKDQTFDETIAGATDYVTEEFYSRAVPSFLSDIAKAIDPYERVGGKGIAGVMSKIPGVRQTLPVKRDIFGDKIEGEPAWSDILFGARVKTARDTAITKEIKKMIDANDAAINFTDWDKSNSETLAGFKKKVGQDVYDKGKIKYGQNLKSALGKLFDSKEYKEAGNEDKMRLIRDADTDAQQKVFNEHFYQYKMTEKDSYNDKVLAALGNRDLKTAKTKAVEFNKLVEKVLKDGKGKLSKDEAEKIAKSKISLDGLTNRDEYKEALKKVIGFNPTEYETDGQSKVNKALSKGDYSSAANYAREYNAKLFRAINGTKGLTSAEKKSLRGRAISITGLRRRGAWLNR